MKANSFCNFIISCYEFCRDAQNSEVIYMKSSQEMALMIKEIAKSKKITVGQMLADCELSVNTLSTMQSKNYYPRLESLVKIADYLDVSVDYLLGQTENNSFNVGDMTNVNNNIMGNNNNVHRQPQENKNYGRYDELIDYLNDLPVSECRYAIAEILDFLESKHPKKKES